MKAGLRYSVCDDYVMKRDNLRQIWGCVLQCTALDHIFREGMRNSKIGTENSHSRQSYCVYELEIPWQIYMQPRKSNKENILELHQLNLNPMNRISVFVTLIWCGQNVLVSTPRF